MLSSSDPATLEQYKSVIATFMSFVHGRLPGKRYHLDRDFTDVELTAVTPSDVCRYMRLKAYGAEFPSATLAFDKKAISFLCLIKKSGV